MLCNTNSKDIFNLGDIARNAAQRTTDMQGGFAPEIARWRLELWTKQFCASLGPAGALEKGLSMNTRIPHVAIPFALLVTTISQADAQTLSTRGSPLDWIINPVTGLRSVRPLQEVTSVWSN